MSNNTPAPFGWIITKDNIDDGNAVGVIGPSTATATATAEQIKQLGRPFRMLDDDGNIYYYGLYLGPDDEREFAPLDNYGSPNAGCTEIQYRNAQGAWKTL